MNQQLFNKLVYCALKYYQARIYGTESQIKSAHYFFSTLWDATVKAMPTREEMDQLLNEEEIENLIFYYQSARDTHIIYESQEHYTQTIVKKLNEHSQTHYSFTMQPNESFSFLDYFVSTHRMEIGLGLLTGVTSGISFLQDQRVWGRLSAIPAIGILGWMGYIYYQWHQLQEMQLVLPHKYLVNLRHQYKIWLPEDIDEELSALYQSQLMGLHYEKDAQLSLVYDSQMSSFAVHQHLLSFCEKHQIKAIDIREDVFPLCTTQQELKLIRIYELEIQNLAKGGNFTLANQILRWLKPIYELGMHHDFNLSLDIKNLNMVYAFKKPMIFHIVNEQQLYIDPSVSLIVNSQDAMSFVEKIQENIINAYELENADVYDDDELVENLSKFQTLAEHQKGRQELNRQPNHLEWRQTIQMDIERIFGKPQHNRDQEYDMTMSQMISNIHKLIDQCCGGTQILKTLQSYNQELANEQESVVKMKEYGFEHYHLAVDKRIMNKSQFKRKIQILEEQPLEYIHEDETIKKSAVIIQNLFRMTRTSKGKTCNQELSGNDWEIISHTSQNLR